MAVQPIPEGYYSVTPALVIDGAEGMLTFIKEAFGGKERFRMPRPDGKIAHSEIVIGDAAVMVGDTAPDQPPVQHGYMFLYVEDVDAVYKKALAAGATTISEPENLFYGDRSGAVRDAWGVRWTIATHVEDVSEEEMSKRMAAMQQAS
jgi:PhnB protein